MQTVERMVYILIAIIVFGLILFYSVKIDYSSILDSIQDEENVDMVFNEHDYMWKITDHWEECAYGELALNRTYVAQFTPDWPGGVIDYSMFMQSIKSRYLCEKIWDVDENCGDRSPATIGSANFAPIEDKFAYLLRCEAGELRIELLN